MLPPDHQPCRVLLGPLEPRVRVGMIHQLRGDGREQVGTEKGAQALLLMAARLRPDAVVLDLGDANSRKLADRVRATSPDTKVILWARDEDAMEVLDGDSDGPRRFFEAVSEELRSELRSCQVNRVEE